MKNINFSSPHSNSFSKFQTNKELYLDSSYISKYLGQQKQLPSPSKFMSTLYRFETSLIKSPQTERDHTIGQYKQLTKNYFQKKYLMMTAGNEQSIKAWRKYLINSLKKKIEDFFNLKKQFVITSKRTLKSKIGSLSNSFQQQFIFNEEINGVHQLVKQRVPDVDLIQEQDNLIKKNIDYLRNSPNIDYDTKLEKMIKQYEIIIDRIQREAFKQKIPDYIEIKMENYNDCYEIKSQNTNPYFSQKLYSSCQSFQFNKEHLIKNQQSKSIFENLNYQQEDEVIMTGKLLSPRITRIQEQLQIQQIKQNQDSVQQDEDQLEFESTLKTLKEKQNLENYSNTHNKDKKKQQNKHRIHKKKNPSRLNNNNEEIQQSDKIDFVDYMLGLDDVYNCNLNPYRSTQNEEVRDEVAEFLEEFEFIDRDEEKVFINFTQWNDNQLLNL